MVYVSYDNNDIENRHSFGTNDPDPSPIYVRNETNMAGSSLKSTVNDDPPPYSDIENIKQSIKVINS